MIKGVGVVSWSMKRVVSKEDVLVDPSNPVTNLLELVAWLIRPDERAKDSFSTSCVAPESIRK